MDPDSQAILQKIKTNIAEKSEFDYNIEIVENPLDREYTFFLNQNLNGHIKGSVPLGTINNGNFQKLQEIKDRIEQETQVPIERSDYGEDEK